jgi:hypothetical protein
MTTDYNKDHTLIHNLREDISLQSPFILHFMEDITSPHGYGSPFSIPTNPPQESKPSKMSELPTSTRTTNNSRAWLLAHAPDDFDLNIIITTHTRSKEPKDTLEEKMFSSLKYEQYHSLTSSSLTSRIPILMAKISCQDVRGNIKDILAGSLEQPLSKKDDHFEGNFKFHFTDLSCHHKDSSEFYIRIDYFQPSDLVNPIIVVVSPPFQVFARRSPKKKRKNFDVFESRLEDLVKCGKKLNEDERREALAMISEKLFGMNGTEEEEPAKRVRIESEDDMPSLDEK